MRAFCYCRVSTEEQSTEDHYSLENQEKKANEGCVSNLRKASSSSGGALCPPGCAAVIRRAQRPATTLLIPGIP